MKLHFYQQQCGPQLKKKASHRLFTHWVANMLRMPVDKGLPNHKDKHDTVTVKWCFLFHCVTVRENVLNICVVAANYLVLSYILLYVDFLTIALGNVIV